MRIARGTHRITFIIGPLAVKLPYAHHGGRWCMFLQGLLANMNEARFATMADPRLCPIHWACPGGFALVMTACQPAEDREVLPAWEDLRADYPRLVECKPSSFGRLKCGRVVAVDYG